MNLLEQEWDMVVSLGIKCNLAPILDVTGKRYISSPFDNMDSVEGLAEAGDLIAQRFKGYFDNIDHWHIRNDCPPKRTDVRAKIIWHQDFPNLYYPHFHAGWFSSEIAPKISQWIVDPNGSLGNPPLFSGSQK
jgi:hypothetical protein